MDRTREQILDFVRQHKQEMQERFGMTKIGLFGNYASGDAREDFEFVWDSFQNEFKPLKDQINTILGALK